MKQSDKSNYQLICIYSVVDINMGDLDYICGVGFSTSNFLCLEIQW